MGAVSVAQRLAVSALAGWQRILADLGDAFEHLLLFCLAQFAHVLRGFFEPFDPPAHAISGVGVPAMSSSVRPSPAIVILDAFFREAGVLRVLKTIEKVLIVVDAHQHIGRLVAFDDDDGRAVGLGQHGRGPPVAELADWHEVVKHIQRIEHDNLLIWYPYHI